MKMYFWVDIGWGYASVLQVEKLKERLWSEVFSKLADGMFDRTIFIILESDLHLKKHNTHGVFSAHLEMIVGLTESSQRSIKRARECCLLPEQTRVTININQCLTTHEIACCPVMSAHRGHD